MLVGNGCNIHTEGVFRNLGHYKNSRLAIEKEKGLVENDCKEDCKVVTI